MLKLLKPANPEDIFLERYDLLMRRGMSLTGNNHAQAEDLVHDAFIQFTLRSSDLGVVENTDAYLNRMLRNMYLSQVRRAAVIQESSFSITNFDSAEIGLRIIDPREHVDVQDELRQICQYACARKETSKTGCVLILRFFHSYYPSEIAQILRTSRKAVDRYLLISRRESKAYLTDPGALRFTQAKVSLNREQLGYYRTTAELLGELRNTVFASCRCDCLTTEELKALYRMKTTATIELSVLSHVVSCPRCLDEVNRLLGLPLLSERSSDDRLGRDLPPDDSGGGGESSGGSIVQSKKRYQRRLKEVLEHRPQELRIAVNGFVLGAQQISSEFNKQVLTVNVDEPIGFIEVFSEQGLRLLFFDVDQPIDGNIEQKAKAAFDCGRTLDLSLSYRAPWPTLNVSYHDPTYETVQSQVETLDIEGPAEAEAQDPTSRILGHLPRLSGIWTKIRSRLPDFGYRTLDLGLFLRPATVTTLFALILIVSLVLLYRPVRTPPLSAVSLLQKAVVAEELVAARTDQVLHRTINLEERADGKVITQRRIEVWHSAEKGITARRLYDQDGALVAGDWRRADGVQTLYHHGARPQLQLAPEKRGSFPINFSNVWQVDPTAKEFTSLIGNPESAQIQETAHTYIVSYGQQGSEMSAQGLGLVKASLTLGKSDLHARELTVLIRSEVPEHGPENADDGPNANRQSAIGNRQSHEFHFVEASFERRSPDSVAPAVFEPEPALLESRRESGRLGGSRNIPASSHVPVFPSTSVATAELELQVLSQLNQADALYGEQVSLTRASEGRLRVQGIVETERRKSEILRALAFLSGNPAVEVHVETVDEATRRQAQRVASEGAIEINSIEVETRSAIPAEPELRAYLAREKGLSGEALDQEIRRFADRAMTHTRQARRHAHALKQIAERFSADDLRTLDAEARNQWLAMITQHARVLQQELEVLRRELQPVFPSVSAEAGDAGIEIGGDADFARAGKRLFELATSVDDAVGRSFSIYASDKTSAPVKSNQFSLSLRSATSLARKISRQ